MFVTQLYRLTRTILHDLITMNFTVYSNTLYTWLLYILGYCLLLLTVNKLYSLLNIYI